MNEQSGQDDFRILRLQTSYEVFGVVIDFLAGMEPFTRFEFGPLARAVQQQIHEGEHIAALTHDRIVGYVGWLRTSEAIAEAWQNGRGDLVGLPASQADTAALTVIAARERNVMLALIAHVRKMNPYRRIYFKREYPADHAARKSSVATQPHRG